MKRLPAASPLNSLGLLTWNTSYLSLNGLAAVGLLLFWPLVLKAQPPAIPSLTPLAQPLSQTEGKSTVSAAAAVRLWAAPKETTGEKIDSKSASFAQIQREGVKPRGRSSPFDPALLTPLAALQRGDNVLIPVLGGEEVTGKVNLVQQEENGWVRVGGELTGANAGSFALSSSGKRVGGTILLPQEEIAYEIEEQPDGKVLMAEKHLSEVMCFPMPRPRDDPVESKQAFGPQESAPILPRSSRAGATAVLYLDFDGETVTDSAWNDGTTIEAEPSPLTPTEIKEVWDRVKEDFWPFNIDVTTDRSRYDNAPVGSRMRCIITPTDTAKPGAEGAAWTYSFALAGTPSFSSTVPCWVFNTENPKKVAETASHELGHTLGLRHDGCISCPDGYYDGHGSGAVGWAPIMGRGYGQELVQWSKGEYVGANNQEDDLAIITDPVVNGFGYAADEAGNSLATAAVLDVPGSVNRTGIITGNNDVDFYAFTVGAPTTIVDLSANPAPVSANLDILLELRNSVGEVLLSNNPDTALNASLSTSLEAGTYYIKIQGIGRGAVEGDDGYSNYGSIGHYLLSGKVYSLGPTITSQPASQTVLVGSPVAFSVVASGVAPLTYQWQRNTASIPDETNASYTITNVQTDDSAWYAVVVKDAFGATRSQDAVLVVGESPPWKSHPWIISQPRSQTVGAGDRVTFVVVVASGSGPLSYQWSRNGSPIAGAIGVSYVISGAQPTDAGDYTVRVSNTLAGNYTDSAPATLTVQYGPIIMTQPQSQTVGVGSAAMFSVSASAVPAPTFQWKFNGNIIPAATNAAYTISNAQSAQTGNYSVIVSNSSGSVTSQPASLALNKPPVVVAFSGVTLSRTGALLLQLSGPPGTDLTIYASSDLRSWTPIATVPNPQGRTQFTEAVAGESRFYRAVAP